MMDITIPSNFQWHQNLDIIVLFMLVYIQTIAYASVYLIDQNLMAHTRACHRCQLHNKILVHLWIGRFTNAAM